MTLHKDNHTELYDTVFTMQCPHCNTNTTITLLAVPVFHYLARFKPKKVGIGYMCNSCGEPIFLKFEVDRYDIGNHKIHLYENPEQVEYPQIAFEFEYLPESVKADFKEALSCYSIGALNAFAAMCRRTIQTAATNLGVKGKDKVHQQITNLKEVADIDDETFDIIKQIVLDGHDGAHPHLPPLSAERTKILVELMKDVLHQLYVRKAKLQRAAELRDIQIKNNNSSA